MPRAEQQPSPEREAHRGGGAPIAGEARQRRLLEQLYAYQQELEAQNRRLRETQEALEAARNRYQDLYDSAPVGYLTLDRHGVVHEANATLARMLGHKPGALNERPLSPWLARGESGPFFAHLREAARSPAIQTADLKMRTAAGDLMDVRMKTLWAGGEGDTLELRCVITDVTEERRLQREARAREQQLAHLSRVAILGEIAATVGHELNQPLSAIGTYAEAARRHLDRVPPDRDKAHDLLARVAEQVRYAGEVIRGVREFARPDATVHPAVNLNEMAGGALRLLETVAAEHGVEVRLELSAGLPPVRANPTQLEQTVVNLLLNAIEAYSGAGTDDRTVALRTRAADGNVTLEVADHGIGLEPGAAAQMFEAFYSTKPRGLGMGLAICRTVVENHGGRIWARPNPGGGATVGFALPASTD